MKKNNYFFYLILCVLFYSCQGNKDTKENNFTRLNDKKIHNTNIDSINYFYYCNKPLLELMNEDVTRNYESYFYSDEPPGILHYIVFSYPNRRLTVYINELRFQKKFNLERSWSLDLLMKEKYTMVELYSGDSLLLRCDCENEKKW